MFAHKQTQGHTPRVMIQLLAGTCFERPYKEISISLHYLSSATVARYRPSGEKHTDLRELMWTLLSSTRGSSWVWLRRKKHDRRPGVMATVHPSPSSLGRGPNC